MYETIALQPLAPPDRRHELALARRAAVYLASQGLDRPAVIACLVEEFDMDAATAETFAARAA